MIKPTKITAIENGNGDPKLDTEESRKIAQGSVDKIKFNFSKYQIHISRESNVWIIEESKIRIVPMSKRHNSANNILVLQLGYQICSFLYDAKSQNTTQILCTYIHVVHSVDWCHNLPYFLYADRYMSYV